MQLPLYPSPDQNAPLTFPSTAGGGRMIFNNWLPSTGPNGFPLYVKGFHIHCEIQIDTNGSATVDAPDWWRWLDTVTIHQKDGVTRVNQLRGDQLLIALIEKVGVERLKMHPDIAISQTDATRNLTFYVPMAAPTDFPTMFDGDDFSMPADLFSRIEFTSALLTADGVAVAGGVITLDSCVWRVEAEVEELDYLLWPAVDELLAVPFSSADLQLTVDGRLMGLSLHQRAAAGGGSLTNLTHVHLPGIWPERLKRQPDLTEHYARHRSLAAGTAATDQGVDRVYDPFLQNRACPVLFATDHEKVWSGEVLGNVLVKTFQSSSITNLVAICRKVLPKNAAVAAGFAKKYNGGKPLQWKVKTRDKTRQDPAAWDEKNRAYLPMKASLPGRRGAGLK
jgi:hypothetical protein